MKLPAQFHMPLGTFNKAHNLSIELVTAIRYLVGCFALSLHSPIRCYTSLNRSCLQPEYILTSLQAPALLARCFTPSLIFPRMHHVNASLHAGSLGWPAPLALPACVLHSGLLMLALQNKCFAIASLSQETAPTVFPHDFRSHMNNACTA